MANRAANLLASIQKNGSESVQERLKGILADVNQASPAKQGKMVKACLETFASENIEAAHIMRPCNCLSARTIAKTKKYYAQSQENISDFLQLLNKNGIGGGRLHLTESGSIIGIYSKCYCGLPKTVKDLPVTYCECSAGWYEKLFSSVFGRSVTVNIVHTILEGASECVFEIR